MEVNLDWLQNPNSKPAKELSKHDQRMIQLGWDASQSFKAEQESRQVPDEKLREKIAEKLYEENEPTLIYDGVTWKKCKGIYPEKTDEYLRQVDQLIALLPVVAPVNSPELNEAELRKEERDRIIKKVDRILYDLACYDPESFDPTDLIKTTQSVISQWQTLKEE